MSDYTTLTIQRSTKTTFERAREAVAEEQGEEPTHDDVVEKLARTYLRQRVTAGGARYNGGGSHD